MFVRFGWLAWVLFFACSSASDKSSHAGSAVVPVELAQLRYGEIPRTVALQALGRCVLAGVGAVLRAVPKLQQPAQGGSSVAVAQDFTRLHGLRGTGGEVSSTRGAYGRRHRGRTA